VFCSESKLYLKKERTTPSRHRSPCPKQFCTSQRPSPTVATETSYHDLSVATQAKPMRAFYASRQPFARPTKGPTPSATIYLNPHRYAARKPLMRMHFTAFFTDGTRLCYLLHLYTENSVNLKKRFGVFQKPPFSGNTDELRPTAVESGVCIEQCESGREDRP
jgi:hypothetical protein